MVVKLSEYSGRHASNRMRLCDLVSKGGEQAPALTQCTVSNL